MKICLSGAVRAGLPGALLATLLLFTAAPLYAQPADGCAGSQKKGDGEDIKCHIQKVLDKHQALTDKLEARLAACTGTHCDMMRKHLRQSAAAREKARGHNGKAKGDDYDFVNTHRKAKCKPGKNCYQEPAELDVSDELETGAGADLVDQLDEVAEGLDTVDTLVSSPPDDPASVAALRSLTANASAFPALYDYKKDGDYPAWLHLADNPKAMIPAVFALTIAATVAQGVATVTKNVCQFDIMGFNASVACIVVNFLAAALDTTALYLNYELSDGTAWDVHGAYLRAGNLNDNLSIVRGAVGDVGDKADATQQSIIELQGRIADLQDELLTTRQRLLLFQNQIIQLLLTPEGQRSVFAAMLTCDGSAANPCPALPFQCSPTTGLCTVPK